MQCKQPGPEFRTEFIQSSPAFITSPFIVGFFLNNSFLLNIENNQSVQNLRSLHVIVSFVYYKTKHVSRLELLSYITNGY